MERAKQLARLYESIDTIPVDIQQSLLQIAQCGCDPDQLRRWYIIVRTHFGVDGIASGSEIPPTEYTPASTASMGNPSVRAGHQMVQSLSPEQSLHLTEWSTPSIPSTPSFLQHPDGPYPWTSGLGPQDRIDSALEPHRTIQAISTATVTPYCAPDSQQLVSPESLLSSDCSISPAYSDASSLHSISTALDHHMFAEPSASVSQGKLPMTPTPSTTRTSTDAILRRPSSSSMGPPAHRYKPSASGATTTTASGRVERRRRPLKKGVREMMAIHQQRYARQETSKLRAPDPDATRSSSSAASLSAAPAAATRGHEAPPLAPQDCLEPHELALGYSATRDQEPP